MPDLHTSDGCRVHYETHGFDADREVVVFLNGMTQTTQHWASHSRALRGQFRVLTYDARGQGTSDVGEAALTIEGHARDLIELLDHIEVEQAHLVGFSHGARIALGLANLAPERLNRLVLCSATAQPTALARTIVRAWNEVLQTGGMEAMAWTALPNILGNQYLEDNERLLPNIVQASTGRNRIEGVRALLEGMMSYPDLSQLARGVQAPTLVISADEDLLVGVDGARQLALLCGGEHVELKGVGHTIPIEAPREFRDLVVAFLNH